MALRLRTVIGKITDAEGTPIENGQVAFVLTEPLGFTSTHVVVDPEVFAVTDSLGDFAIDLWADEDSLTPVNYTVSVPIANDGPASPTHTATISLAYEDGSDKDIGTLIAESQPPPSETDIAVWRDLIDSRIDLAVLNDLSDVVITAPVDGHVIEWDSATSKWINAAPGSGASIGGGVTGATEGSVFFAGAAGVLAQDNANLFWDNANNRLRIPAIQLPSGTTLELRDNAGGLAGSIGIQAGSFPLGITSSGWLSFVAAFGMQIQSAEGVQISGNGASQVPLSMVIAAAQSANAFQVLPNGSSTPYFHVGPNQLTAPVLQVVSSAIAGADTKGIDIWCGGGATANAYALRFRDGSRVAWQNLTAGGLDLVCNDGSIVIRTSGGTGTRRVDIQAGNSADAARFDDSSTATHTRFFVYDVDNGQLERVTVGAADSGGAGFKVLRIPN